MLKKRRSKLNNFLLLGSKKIQNIVRCSSKEKEQTKKFVADSFTSARRPIRIILFLRTLDHYCITVKNFVIKYLLARELKV